MRFYGYWRSSASWRVRIALAWKGISYEFQPVHLLRDGGEQHGDAYRTKNPMAQVPLLELDDGRSLSQSVAILEYLEEVHPLPRLLPEDPYLRAKVRQVVEIINSGIQPLQNLSVQQKVEAFGGDKGVWAKHWIEKGLAAVERELAALAGAYCVGDEVTFADLCLAPQLYAARRMGVDVAAYPTCARVEQACSNLPAFRSSHADAQPDASP